MPKKKQSNKDARDFMGQWGERGGEVSHFNGGFALPVYYHSEGFKIYYESFWS